jgi:hypothetical protein
MTSYQEMMRNPQAWRGHEIDMRGRVAEVVQQKYAAYVLRLNTSADMTGDPIWVEFDGVPVVSDGIYQGAFLDVQGKFVGIKSYRSVTGANIQIPAVVACKIFDGNEHVRRPPAC